jgi:hypothetical protein
MSAKKYRTSSGRKAPKLDSIARSVDLACSKWLRKRGIYFSPWKPRTGEAKIDFYGTQE